MVFGKKFTVFTFLVVALLASGCLQPPGNGGNGNGGLENHFCSPESRDVDACTLVLQPVCGWSNPAKIQCFAFPCADNYSNSCLACMNENVLYWTEGNCPE